MRTRTLLALALLAVSALASVRAQAPATPPPAPPSGSATPSGAAPAPTPPAGQPAPVGNPAAISPRPVGTMSQLMVDVIYPASDALFYISTRTPTTTAEWSELQGKALMVAEAGNLLMMPGRARDNDRWMTDAKLMVDAFTAAYRAAKDKDVPAIENLNEQLVASCTRCHIDYRPGYGRRPIK